MYFSARICACNWPDFVLREHISDNIVETDTDTTIYSEVVRTLRQTVRAPVTKWFTVQAGVLLHASLPILLHASLPMLSASRQPPNAASRQPPIAASRQPPNAAQPPRERLNVVAAS